VRPDDPHELAKTLRGLLDDVEARRRLSEAARAYARVASTAAAAARTVDAYRAARELGRG